MVKQPPNSNPVATILDNNKIISSKYSTVRLTTNRTTFPYFAQQEAAEGYPQFAKYNTQGKNPLDSQVGKLLAGQLKLYGPDFKQIDFSAGTTAGDYKVLDAATQLLAQLAFEIRLNKDPKREAIGEEFHEALPQVMRGALLGTGTVNGHVPVSALVPANGGLENERKVLRLPLDLKAGDSFTVEARHPIGVDAVLNNYLLVFKLLTIEDKAAK
ncbi:hypothetical protein [Leptospira ilyithenensis]|uniref:Uncharacterized protein n=1 Tax=Leptospira ilyithenensis TaxID=2484901 RepID=A0A4R9LMQ4_9LEPT|nr:hypothetical protein [Leptospira ilyithenensis]TGN09768.1 hypothetical protein EHS11_11845 [Leptospira ilyithenensis]